MLASAVSADDATCHGHSTPIVGDMGGMDWDDIFPITVFGVQLGPHGNPPAMNMRKPCWCPGIGAIVGIENDPGIPVTYFAPQYMVEVQRDPGCLSTIGGEKIDSSHDELRGSGGSDDWAGAQSARKMQVHFMKFAVFAILEIFADLGCAKASPTVFDIAYMTEYDNIWQNDEWAAYLAPESTLVANPIAEMACSADAIATAISYPLDFMFWCAGAAHIYPLSGNDQDTMSNAGGNIKLLARFLARQHRVGFLWTQIGASAECSAHYAPFMMKSQYRIDPTYPYSANTGRPITLGRHWMFWGAFPANPPPTHESQNFMLWVGNQCCVRI
jgi:conjugal transfer pilus assembly protein TraU